MVNENILVDSHQKNSFGSVNWSFLSVLLVFAGYQICWNIIPWSYLIKWLSQELMPAVDTLIANELFSLILTFGIKFAFVIAILVVIIRSKTKIASLGIRIRNIPIKPLYFILPLLWALVTIYLHVFINSNDITKVVISGIPVTKTLVLATWFFRGVAGPFCEEVIFRGFIYLTIRRYMKVSPAIIISTIVFAIIHYNGGIHQIIVAAIMGFIFNCFYEKTKSFLQTSIFHSLINSARLLLALNNGHL